MFWVGGFQNHECRELSLETSRRQSMGVDLEVNENRSKKAFSFHILSTKNGKRSRGFYACHSVAGHFRFPTLIASRTIFLSLMFLSSRLPASILPDRPPK